jgi:hypothetical protein
MQEVDDNITEFAQLVIHHQLLKEKLVEYLGSPEFIDVLARDMVLD